MIPPYNRPSATWWPRYSPEAPTGSTMTSPLNIAIYAGQPSQEELRPAISVSIEEARESFSLFGKGLSERYLQAKSLMEAPTFLANTHRPFPFSNGREIFLPASLDVFDSHEDNWRVYRLYTTLQAGQWEVGTFDRPRTDMAETLYGRQPWMEKKEPLAWIRAFLAMFSMPGLAGDIFLTLEIARTAASIANRFGGIARDLEWFIERLNRPAEPLDHRLILWNLFFTALGFSTIGIFSGFTGEILDAASRVTSPEAVLKDTLEATIVIYRLMEPSLKASLTRMEKTLLDEIGASPMGTMRAAKKDRSGQKREPSSEEGGSLAEQDPEAVLGLDFYSYDILSGSGEFLTEDALGKQIDRDVQDADGERSGRDESDESRMLSSEEGEEELRVSYPEWDYLAGGYRRGWTTLYQLRAAAGDAQSAARLLQEWDDLVREVVRQFRMLRFQERAWRKRLESGHEIDIEEAVARQVEMRCGLPLSDKVYMEKRRVTREVSALFLLDLSASTSSQIAEGTHAGETVLWVLMASMAIMARALDQLGDRYGIYGFSGYGRNRVEVLRIKSFDENLDDEVWRRLGGLKPIRSTRMGAAVRHCHRILDRETSPLKILLLLSDGYPQDFDYGEDRTDREYGLRDTAQAMREAEAGNIIPFFLTVDAAGHDYLRRISLPYGYLVLKSVEDLPSELPKVYLRLRGM